MTTTQDPNASGPGVGAAFLAFAVFVIIAAGSVAVAQRSGTLYDDGRWVGRESESSDGGRVEVAALMRHVRHRSETQDFRRAEMVTIAGSSVLDLSGARMKAEKGTLEVVVIAGSAFVKVPPDWAVVSTDSISVGQIDNRARKAEGSLAGKLRLEAVVLGGRLEVSH